MELLTLALVMVDQSCGSSLCAFECQSVRRIIKGYSQGVTTKIRSLHFRSLLARLDLGVFPCLRRGGFGSLWLLGCAGWRRWRIGVFPCLRRGGFGSLWLL